MSGYPTARALSKPAGRDRIVIGGVDVTTFRGSTTPFPRFLLTEPYAYGSTSIQFPQVDAGHEQLGVGDLSWARTGATVYIQRVLEDDSIVTDYVGVVMARQAEGRILNLDIGGRVSGRASLIQRQPPVVRRVRDIGRHLKVACQDINIPLIPGALGPVTGIEIPDSGGMSHLGWLDTLGAMSQTLNGTQRALMPVTWGSNPFQFVTKDYTNKDLTLFNDDARVVCTLTDDASEQPNTWFASGVTPKGTRWKNAKYPGYFEDEDPPAYPIAGGANFGIGTEDADTITGDGIEVLKDKLVAMGYLPAGFGYDGTYDQDIYDAVHDLKNDAGLSDNGTMTTAAWAALFDLDVTGYSTVGAMIHPMRQNSNVRKWNYTAEGNLASRNDGFDPSALRVDRTIDFGAGVEKASARKFIQGQAARAAGQNWTGTIRLNSIGAFAGEVNPEDIETLTADDVMSYRDIRPGMNAWLPLFDGGTLVHISGVDVDADGATLTVDTQARDLMEVSEIIARNRESRRDVRREWKVTNLGARPTGNMVSRDERFGRRDTDKALVGDRWNVVPVIVGQSGSVNHTHIKLTPGAEYVVAVFSNKVTRKQLARTIGNPFPLNDDFESVWEQESNSDFLDDKILLYASGDETQPCGYGKRAKFRPDGETLTGAALTGLHLDDATWPYLSDSSQDPVIWLAIYPLDDCVLKRGLLFSALEDDVT